jgi:hypothetical protein
MQHNYQHQIELRNIDLVCLQQYVELVYLEQLHLAVELGQLQMFNYIIQKRKEVIKAMLDAALSTVLSSGFLGAASYIAVATAIVNPVALTAIGVAGIAAGVYLQIKQIKGAR